MKKTPSEYQNVIIGIKIRYLHSNASEQYSLLLCYVELFTVGSLQFCNDSTIASLEANQNRPKIQYYVNN